MAKLTAPLLSFNARGQVGKTLVMSGWKGLKTARQYVIPANPNTAGQQTQRGLMTNAVTAWKTAGFTAIDKAAYDLAALQASSPLSGFNIFTRYFLDCYVAGDVWQNPTAGTTSALGAAGFTFTQTVAADKGGTLYIGTSPTAMLTPFAGVFDTDHYTYTVTGLAASTKYFFYCNDTDSGFQAKTGIYTATTTA